MIKAFFYAWGGLPWRKPLAMTAGFCTLALAMASFVLNRDIPPNACNLLIWIDLSNGCPHNEQVLSLYSFDILGQPINSSNSFSQSIFIILFVKLVGVFNQNSQTGYY